MAVPDVVIKNGLLRSLGHYGNLTLTDENPNSDVHKLVQILTEREELYSPKYRIKVKLGSREHEMDVATYGVLRMTAKARVVASEHPEILKDRKFMELARDYMLDEYWLSSPHDYETRINSFAGLDTYLRSHQQPMFDDVLDQVGIEKNHAVLDIGCGGGVITEWIAKRADKGEVVGIDPFERPLELAKKRLGKYKNVTVRKGDIGLALMEKDEFGELCGKEHPPNHQEPYGKYDHITMFDVVSHLTDRMIAEQVPSEAFKLLKAGGKFTMSAPIELGKAKIDETIRDYAKHGLVHEKTLFKPSQTFFIFRKEKAASARQKEAGRRKK